MSRPRPQALDNLVFGLAIFLFCVVGYYAFKQARQRRGREEAPAARPSDLPLSAAAMSSSDDLGPELAHTGARGAVSGVPAVASDAGVRR